MLTLVLWNVRWRPPQSPAGQMIQAVIARERPDLVCLTEGHSGSLAEPAVIASDADFGPGSGTTRRKVLLWSRQPWRHVDTTGSPLMPKGRFVAGETHTPVGQVCVVGVCVPYAEALMGRPPAEGGSARWEAHRRYLHGLDAAVTASGDGPTILLGDFNQTVPRSRQPRDVADPLAAIFAAGFTVATAGLGDGAIDHCAVRGGLEPVEIRRLENRGHDGRPLSDHVGVVIRIGGRLVEG